MYVIIFSIDKNYEIYRELKNGGGGFKKSLVKLKNPPCPLGKGESHQLDSKVNLIIQKFYSTTNSWQALRCNSPFKGGKGDYYPLTCPELSLHKVNYYETTKRTKNKRNRISELG